MALRNALGGGGGCTVQRYKGVGVGGGVGVGVGSSFPEKKRYVTLEWPLRRFLSTAVFIDGIRPTMSVPAAAGS